MRAFELGHHAGSDSSKGDWQDDKASSAVSADAAGPNGGGGGGGNSTSPTGSVKGVWAAKGSDGSGRRVVHTFDVEEA